MSVSNKMMIPKTITVGYQERKDTYTGKLAYVIYTDDKGVLRKEKSWEGWRDKKIPADHYTNEPRTGFVLNKKVGGYKSEWNVRNTYVRVFDPHGFEFEISVPTLLFILQETSAIQGKGLEGEFVYAWHGTELVLLPTCSNEYKESIKFTKHQVTKVSKEDRVEGCMYLMKDMTEVLYLGKHEYCTKTYVEGQYKPIGPRHVFVDLKRDKKITWKDPYIATSGFDRISAKISDVSPEYAEEYDNFKKSRYCDKVVDIKLTPASISKDSNYKCFILKDGDKNFLVRLNHNYRWNANQDDFLLIRGGEVNLKIEKGVVALPKKGVPYGYGSASRENYHSSRHDLYSAILVTAKGHTFNLTNNT